jgi:hypothetical protein
MNVKGDGTLEFTEPVVFRSLMTFSVNTLQFINSNSMGTGLATLGTACPAVTGLTPYAWLRILTPDGSVAYLPAWK